MNMITQSGASLISTIIALAIFSIMLLGTLTVTNNIQSINMQSWHQHKTASLQKQWQELAPYLSSQPVALAEFNAALSGSGIEATSISSHHILIKNCRDYSPCHQQNLSDN